MINSTKENTHKGSSKLLFVNCALNSSLRHKTRSCLSIDSKNLNTGKIMSNAFDIIVIGGGHAGCEAAWTTARLGKKTLLVSLKKSTSDAFL